MTTTEQTPGPPWPQLAVLRRRLAWQLQIRPFDLSPVGKQRFDQYVQVRARLDAVDRALRLYEGDDAAELLAVAGPLSEVARAALADLAEELAEPQHGAD